MNVPVFLRAVFQRAATLFVCTAPLIAQDWPAFRGPTGDGVCLSEDVPTDWGPETNVKWKIPLAHPANGSPIVIADRVFLTTPEDPEGKQRSLYCYDRAKGEQLWVKTVDFGKVMPTHDTNPYCATTPAAAGDRVVVWHGSAGLYCYDFAGEELWRRDFGEFRHTWGYGTSPVLHDGKVFLHTGPGEQSFVTALDLATGATIWRADEPDHRDAEAIASKRLVGSWCTPLITTVDDAEQVICSHPTRVVGYDPDDGTILWSCSGITSKRGDLTYSSPVIGNGICMIVGGYVGPTLGIRLAGARGDVTETHRVWRHDEQMSNCASGIFAGGHFFIPDMNGFLVCIDPATGKQKWRERIGRGSTWGSIIEAEGRLYLMNQKGTTVVFAPNAEKLEVWSRNELGERTNSTPAIADGEIFLRTHRHLYCIAAGD